MKQLSIDIETYSSIDITKSGMYQYVQSSDFSILLFAYSVDGGAVEVVDFTAGESLPSEILSALTDPTVQKHAYNAAFEWYCLSKYLGLKAPEAWLPQWYCTMVHGLYCGYTAGLAATGAAVGLPPNEQKLKIGKSLINIFCKPCKPTQRNGGRTRTLPKHEPEKWELFKDYCRQDVVTEMAIGRQLESFPLPESIHKEWVLDMKINTRGVSVDRDLIEGALHCAGVMEHRLTEEAIALTELDNPNSTAQLKDWLTKETGKEVDNLRKENVTEMLKQEIPQEKVKRMLEIRQELSKTSVKKYDAMERGICEDGRIRGLIQFYGANRTGRWAGRFVQVHNLPRNYLETLDIARNLVKSKNVDGINLLYGNVSDTLSQLIRTAFVPSKGHRFVIADFSAIEARVIAWLADERWRQEVFATHGKIYEASASNMFGVPIERIKKGNPEYALRAKGKVAELALGYQGSAGALINMGALKTGLTEEELPDIVDRWRASNPRIKDLWTKLEQAALIAVRDCTVAGGPHGILFRREWDLNTAQDFLTITLPSGRKLFYCKPYIGENRWGRPSVCYYGVDQNTKKWKSIETYGGKLTENIVQAIARDCLMVTLQRLEQAGLPVVMHVHDEAIIDCPEDRVDLKAACDLMGQPIDWAPGLLLRADGFVSDYYKKD